MTDSRDTWPPPHMDERIDELVSAGAQLTPEAVLVHARQLRDATQRGLDASAALVKDMRRELASVRDDLSHIKSQLIVALQTIEYLREQNAKLVGEVQMLRAEVAQLKPQEAA